MRGDLPVGHPDREISRGTAGRLPDSCRTDRPTDRRTSVAKGAEYG